MGKESNQGTHSLQSKIRLYQSGRFSSWLNELKQSLHLLTSKWATGVRAQGWSPFPSWLRIHEKSDANGIVYLPAPQPPKVKERQETAKERRGSASSHTDRWSFNSFPYQRLWFCCFCSLTKLLLCRWSHCTLEMHKFLLMSLSWRCWGRWSSTVVSDIHCRQ